MIAEIRRQQKETVEACLKRTMNIVIDGFFDEGLADVKITRVNVDVGNDSQVMNVTLFFEKKKQCVTACVEDLEENSLTKTNV